MAYKSVVSPKYYGEILKTPFEFSLKYYAVLVLIAAVITSVGTYFIEAPKIKDTFQNALTEAEKVYPEDLIFTIKAGEWEINKPEPLVIPFPGTYEAKDKEKLPENLLAEVFDFIQFLEIKREKNLLAKASQELSTASFEKIWDNKEDAVYDSLY